MKTRISVLVDGELEADEVAGVVVALSRDSEQEEFWRLYHLIGDAIRHEPDLTIDVTNRVMAALSLEPTVLSPRPQRSIIRWQRPVMALAASAAGVAVVAWVALAPVQMPVESMIAANQAPIAPPVPTRLAAMTPSATRPIAAVSSGSSAHPLSAAVETAQLQETARLQEYLVAHQAYEGGVLVGGASHIRTVSASGINY